MTEILVKPWQRQLGQAAIVAFICFQIYVSVLGFDIYFGPYTGAVVVMLSIILRLGVTFVIGAFLCAYFVWGWPMFGAALFSAPALILLFPHLLADAFGAGRRLRGKAKIADVEA